MIISKFVDVNLNPLNIKHYENLGYDIKKRLDKKNRYSTPKGTSIIVKVEHLPNRSKCRIEFKCDYCGKEFSKTYADYTIEKEKNLVDKDACKDCKQLKLYDCNIIRYGVKSLFEKEEFREKCNASIKRIYGVENAFQSQIIKDKIITTIKQKYGEDFNNIMDVPVYKELAFNNMMKSRYENGTVPTSIQQLYIYQLVSGELNYLFNNCFLDIAFPNEYLYIEYQGNGHDLAVKLNSISKEQFKHRELKRYNFLKSHGWKEIEILSAEKDLLPEDKLLIESINFSKNLLNNSDYNWIKIDLQNNNIILKDEIIHYNFGKLRRITKSDLELVTASSF